MRIVSLWITNCIHTDSKRSKGSSTTVSTYSSPTLGSTASKSCRVRSIWGLPTPRWERELRLPRRSREPRALCRLSYILPMSTSTARSFTRYSALCIGRNCSLRLDFHPGAAFSGKHLLRFCNGILQRLEAPPPSPSCRQTIHITRRRLRQSLQRFLPIPHFSRFP